MDENGIACRGLLIRHLVMPSLADDTRAVLRFVKESVSKDAFVNIMAQYHPCYRSHECAELSGRISHAEFASALQYARDIGLERAWNH
jgi:putative pyruvate formate lyase activating enzyme